MSEKLVSMMEPTHHGKQNTIQDIHIDSQKNSSDCFKIKVKIDYQTSLTLLSFLNTPSKKKKQD